MSDNRVINVYKCKCLAGKNDNDGNDDDNKMIMSRNGSNCSSLARKYSACSSVDHMAAHRNTLGKYFPFNRRRIKKSLLKTVGLSVIAALALTFLQLNFGFYQRYFLERDFRKEGFHYPMDVPDFPGIVKRYIEAHSQGLASTFQPRPVNLNYSSVAFIEEADTVSNGSAVGLLIVVKSAPRNFRKRMAIRKTWGNPDYLRKHQISPDLPTRVAFMCGIPEYYDGGILFPGEEDFDDIILAQFQDSYGNNTYKTILVMKWALDYVKNFKYLLIVDDDMYLSPSNAVSFINNVGKFEVRNVISGFSGAPAYYPVSQLEANVNVSVAPPLILGEMPLIMGQLWQDSKPFRNRLGGGAKWSISIDLYPYNYFPPYVAGAATLIDSATVANLYYGSLFTNHFWIDDVYIGIIAKKLGIALTNNELIDASYRKPNAKLKHDIKDMIAVHGLACPEQLVELWRTMDISSLSDCNAFPPLV